MYICDWLLETDPNRTLGISRITNLKYLTHCESLLLGCSQINLQYSYNSYLASVIITIDAS